MQNIVNLDDVPVVERTHARAGRFRSRSLLHGVEDTPENFYLQLSQTYADFVSPRHRHNFDQVRVQLEGDADFARDGVMRPGTIGYFPEGVFYGPQSIAGESATLVLQFGGASGSGYISEDRFQQGVSELKAHGSFDRGIYTRQKDDGGRKNQDAYEAVWEHLHGRPLVYPKSELPTPVFIDPATFEWEAEPGAAGVRRKALGRFSARELELHVLGLDAGATARLAPHSIVFVLAGAGASALGEWTTRATLRTGDEAEAVTASAPAELLEIRIPPLEAH